MKSRISMLLVAAATCMAIAAPQAFAASAEKAVQQPHAMSQYQHQAPSITSHVEAVKSAYAEAVKPASSVSERARSLFKLVVAVVFGAAGGGGVTIAMTTLAANKPRAYELGNRNCLPVIASDILYEGSAIGIVAGTGHTRPLVAGDVFVGFAEVQADNSAGAAAAINVELIKSGEIQLSVAGAVITDVEQPVYASDDDTFTFVPTGASFIGFVKRFVSSGVVVVDFDAGVYKDPYGDRTVKETKSANYTLDAEDSGKVLFIDTDAFTLTLPVIATGLDGVKIVNIGAFGAVAVTISPAAADMILGPDITGADDKDLINTKATARRGDYVVIGGNDADGYAVQEIKGIWARQA